MYVTTRPYEDNLLLQKIEHHDIIHELLGAIYLVTHRKWDLLLYR